jgi:hypothetical protein
VTKTKNQAPDRRQIHSLLPIDVGFDLKLQATPVDLDSLKDPNTGTYSVRYVDDDGREAVAEHVDLTTLADSLKLAGYRVHGLAIAAIGTDGTRPVVWGLGATEDEARTDARQWLDAGDDEALEFAKITLDAWELVDQGGVAYGPGEPIVLVDGVLQVAEVD